ncbi:MAG TPA: choice-of-anchor tandem repeat GloVer-containing protein [Rhizomicrobium sp.]|jgi:uncharacterized repeat protein (TIGR03803 family)|nr:choice-of-anchor tandem repeat GloVer-containing protein [Rhizomicrobium sp.]
MLCTLDVCRRAALACGFVLAALAAPAGAQAAGFKVLYSFKGGSDGAAPAASVLADKAGNLYGTTFNGGGTSCDGLGCGTVFSLAPDGTETVLHAFAANQTDGKFPAAGLIADDAGNLYGTATAVGRGNNSGAAFKIAPDGTETVLHFFHGQEGSWPRAGLIADGAGNLYGTNSQGGGGFTYGTVFELTPDGTVTTLLPFTGSGNGGKYPEAGLIADKAGNLYGTTASGGGSPFCAGFGCGTVFKIAPATGVSILYSFTDGEDGATPQAGLIADKAGNLYGTTLQGGGSSCPSGAGCGVVFRLAPDGTETVLYAFTGGSDGSNPVAGLVADKDGNLYGTASQGGDTADCGIHGCGTVFKLAPDGAFTVLHAFTGGIDGSTPVAGLTMDRKGRLYGTTPAGGAYNHGVVFRIKP